MSAIEWGTFGDYVGGVGTLAAAVIAIVALRQERNRRERWQADLLAVSGELERITQWKVEVSNHSHASIFDVTPFSVRDTELRPREQATLLTNSRVTCLMEFNDLSLYQNLTRKDWGVHFRDSSGALWAKYGDGLVKRLKTVDVKRLRR